VTLLKVLQTFANCNFSSAITGNLSAFPLKQLTLAAIKHIIGFFVLLLCFSSAYCQQLTGVWKGRINNSRVELKMIQNGDSITGTSYYHGLLNNYRRYTIKGYFDPYTNSVVWWDDQLISNNGVNTSEKAWLSVADFDCPGSGRMFLDGKTSEKDTKQTKGVVSLTKVDRSSFHDEWDFIINTYTRGGNNRYLIDSVSRIALARKPEPEKVIIAKQPKPVPEKIITLKQPKSTPTPAPSVAANTPPLRKIPEPALAVITKPAKPLTIDEMFNTRKKIFNTEIPLSGDSIELRFYDNAEVDGDSISLFLNDKMIFTHVRLTGNAYTIRLPVKDMQLNNELVMVAENLGAIPPNTSFMVAFVGDKRYEAQLESTENSSCLIRLRKSSN
jgi:hypothetical protein